MHKRQQTGTPNFKVGDRVFFKNTATWQMGPKKESWLQKSLHRVQQILHLHRKPSYMKKQTLQWEGCCTQTVIQVVEC